MLNDLIQDEYIDTARHMFTVNCGINYFKPFIPQTVHVRRWVVPADQFPAGVPARTKQLLQSPATAAHILHPCSGCGMTPDHIDLALLPPLTTPPPHSLPL